MIGKIKNGEIVKYSDGLSKTESDAIKKIGQTSISDIGDGTISDAINVTNNKINNKMLLDGKPVKSVELLLEGYKEKSLPNLPRYETGSSFVSFRNEIYMLGGNFSPFDEWNCFDGERWKIMPSQLPFSFLDGAAVVLNGEIHILCGNRHAKFSLLTEQWEELNYLPYPFEKGRAVVFNDEIHIFGGLNNTYEHYIYENNHWIKGIDLPFPLPYSFLHDRSMAVLVCYNKIHIFTPYSHVEYDEENLSWINKMIDIPPNEDNFAAVNFNNKIYLLGVWGETGRECYKIDEDNNWIKLPVLVPPSLQQAVVNDNKIYIISDDSVVNSLEEYYSITGVKI